jgi:periplasmic protein TonB
MVFARKWEAGLILGIMANIETLRNPQDQALPPEPVLNLLLKDEILDEPLYKRLFRGLDEFFFPKKLPPLVLTSKPIPVRDIWGFYNYKRRGAFGSTVIHMIGLALIIGGTLFARKVVKDIVAPKQTVELIAPDSIPALQPSKTLSGGGGGGGDRDKLQASKGRLPKQSMDQFTPPAVVVRNEKPKLPMEATVVIPPQVHLVQPNMPNLGDPLSRIPAPPSNGVGSGGGIGSGSGGGVGVGTGPGFGEGRGGGTGGGVFRVGGGVSAPRVIYQPDPEYSEEARKAKYQGVCVLWLIVGPDGKPRDIKVARTLGLGLDEKAMEAVKTWRFEPAMKDGKPVAVQINVEVQFRLY